MWRMTRRTTFGLYRGVLISKWALLISMALDARGISSSRQPRLLQFETAMRIVTIAALHHAFKNLVMKRFLKVWFYLTVTTNAQLRFTCLQQGYRREVGFFAIRWINESYRARDIPPRIHGVRRVTIGAPDVIAPVFAAAEIVSFFATSVTSQTSFGDLF